MNILFAINERYMMYSKVMLTSLFENNKWIVLRMFR